MEGEAPYGTVRWVSQIARDLADLRESRMRIPEGIEEAVKNEGSRVLFSERME